MPSVFFQPFMPFYGQSMTLTESILKELTDQKYALDQSSIVAATDRAGTITYVNQRFCDVSGYPRGELLGQNHRILSSGHHGAEFFTELWRTIASGHVWRGDICNRKKNGEIYWVSTTIVPFLDERSRPYQYLSIRHEITALKFAEQKILEQQAQLASSSRLSALGEISASLTHEINNPLGVILGRVEMLKSMLAKEPLDVAALRRITETIEVTGQRIDKIVRSMRVFAHQGDLEPFENRLLSEILAMALDLTQERFRVHGIELRLSIQPDVMVSCRPTLVMQILVNLLNNAHDAVLKQSKKWVEVQIYKNDRETGLLVTDAGNGIPSDLAEKLFKPFFTTKPVAYGTGLGLSIAKTLADKTEAELMYNSASPYTQFKLFWSTGSR